VASGARTRGVILHGQPSDLIRRNSDGGESTHDASGWCSACLVATTVFATSAIAQETEQAHSGWNPATVQTVKGTVTGAKEVGKLKLVFVAVKTDSATEVVILGPSSSRSGARRFVQVDGGRGDRVESERQAAEVILAPS